MSNSLRPHGLQHSRLPCPSLSLWVCSNSYPLSEVCHANITSSVAPFSSCPQSVPASGSFPMSLLFTSGGQSIRALASHQSFQWIFRVDFLYDWLVWFICCPRYSQESSTTPQFKSINILHPALFMVQLSHPYTTTGKAISLTLQIFAKWCVCLLILCLGLS